jgi:hypothetical protein
VAAAACVAGPAPGTRFVGPAATLVAAEVAAATPATVSPPRSAATPGSTALGTGGTAPGVPIR